MRYIPTYYQNLSQKETQKEPEIKGYQKQFSFITPEGAKRQQIKEESITENPVTPDSIFTEADYNILNNGGTKSEMAEVGTRYLAHILELTEDQASAILGCAIPESNININAVNKEEASGKSRVVKPEQAGFGIIQWTGDRSTAAKKYMSEHGGNSYKNQLDFMAEEIKQRPEFLKNLRNAESLREATGYVYTQYVMAQLNNVNKDNWEKKANHVQNMYNSIHTELYSSTGSADFMKRVKGTEWVRGLIKDKQHLYKLGGMFPHLIFK